LLFKENVILYRLVVAVMWDEPWTNPTPLVRLGRVKAYNVILYYVIFSWFFKLCSDGQQK